MNIPIHQQEHVTSEVLWVRFKDGLRRFLQARLPSEADADDVLQEVFLRLHNGLPHLRHTDRVQSWVFGIARRAVADFYRAQGRRRAHVAAVDVDDLETDLDLAPPDNLSRYAGSHDVHEEVLSWLRPMIDALPEPYAVALRMADVEGKTQQDVADALGLSLSGAKSRVQRGRAMLGEVLQQCCEVEFGDAGRAVAFRRRRPADDPCDDEGCT